MSNVVVHVNVIVQRCSPYNLGASYCNSIIPLYYLLVPARWLWMGAVGLHHWSVSAAVGASLRGRVSGVSLLQSHCRENTRLAHIILAVGSVY